MNLSTVVKKCQRFLTIYPHPFSSLSKMKNMIHFHESEVREKHQFSLLYYIFYFPGDLKFLIIQLMILVLVPSSLSIDANCNYRQNLQVGNTYYVYNTNYPNSYPRSQSCRWLAYAPTNYRIQLTCTVFQLPAVSLLCFVSA